MIRYFEFHTAQVTRRMPFHKAQLELSERHRVPS